MLFNSYPFILLFLPVTFVGFQLLARWNATRQAAGWLAICSLFFYGYWNPRFLLLLVASIAFNYAISLRILRARQEHGEQGARIFLVLAVAANLAALGYFKYFNFFLDSLAYVFGPFRDVSRVVLPIGISFFTFTQIAYLVDAYRGKARETNPVHYALFVTYFPHLIAGPILHHSEMMPQFGRAETYRLNLRNVASGMALFTIGLFKKVILADSIQRFVAPVFDAPLAAPLHPVAAWGGALAYAMQLYFDFSGYTDMALGLSRMFNIELPQNFNSPYKSWNIIEFWRRWHMTLSRFLRDYLYVPLGGNRRGPARRYVNLMVTMLLGGLWHGAGWTFVIWGGLHGLYLMINHAWQGLTQRAGRSVGAPRSALGRWSGVIVTFVAVTVAWVFFRATSLEAAMRVLSAMFRLPEIVDAVGAPGGILQYLPVSPSSAIGPMRQLAWTVGLMGMAFLAPNSQQIIAGIGRWSDARGWKHDGIYAFVAGSLVAQIGLLAVINASRGVSEFIYFNF